MQTSKNPDELIKELVKKPKENKAINFFIIMTASITVDILISFIIMLLWNYVMPAVFNLPEINFFQALGLFILTRLLIYKHN